MKQFLSYLVTVLMLSVALTTVSLGRSDTGPPDKVVTNHQTDVIAIDVVNTVTVPAAIDERQEIVLLMKEEAVINRKEVKPTFDPFYNERRQAERTRYYITDNDKFNDDTGYHLRC
jgi:hypothetical protein